MEQVITKDYLEHEYLANQKSFADIAKDLGTYTNRVYRLAKKFEIPIRPKSESQKLVLSQGKKPHPTAGRKMSDKTKELISNKVSERWASLSDEEKAEISKQKKETWNRLSEAEKQDFFQKGIKAVLESAKSGSKLEKWLYQELTKNGYKVDFHKEQKLMNERLQIDLYLPKLGVAIEVDGPSHFEAVWGEKAFNRNVRADQEKTGLLLSKGLRIIRIKNVKCFSQKFKRDTLSKLLNALQTPTPEKYTEI